MHNKISSRILCLSTSATLAMAQRSMELREAGVDVIDMAVGEPDFNTPDFIKEAAKRAIDENYSHYSPTSGYQSLREAIAAKIRADKGLDYHIDQIVVGNGAKQELSNAILALINPGDEVIIPSPGWVSYFDLVKFAGGFPVSLQTGPETDFKIVPEALGKAINSKTKMLIINSPSNPCGSVYSLEELEALATVLEFRKDIIVLTDDVYDHINYTGEIHNMAEIPSMKDRTVVINGVSKTYAMTGWRIGWMLAPLGIAQAVAKLQSQTTTGASSIAQKAAEAALTGPQECVAEMREAFRRRRDLIVPLACEIPGWRVNEPQGAFYIFPDVKDLLGNHVGDRVIRTSGDYVDYLLEEAHVATVDGAAFGTPGFIRLSYSTSEENIRKAMDSIRTATARLEK